MSIQSSSSEINLRLRTLGESVAEAWIEVLLANDPGLQPANAQLEDWHRDACALWHCVVDLLPRPGMPAPRILPPEALELAGRIGASWVHEGFLPSDAARFVLAARHGAARVLADDAALKGLLPAVEQLTESLGLAVYQSHGQSRERMIQAQGLSLIELTSPVIKIWDQILLLPLVGVIDTLRARTITERLLESIVQSEAEITIIDVTGVPVFDTSVAGHLMKTVTAAEMLGTTIILTGISAEGAQTLVKLGVDLRGLNTRGPLRAGLAEAFARTGRRVVTQPMMPALPAIPVSGAY